MVCQKLWNESRFWSERKEKLIFTDFIVALISVRSTVQLSRLTVRNVFDGYTAGKLFTPVLCRNRSYL